MTVCTAWLPGPLPQGTNHGYRILRHGPKATLGLTTETKDWKAAAQAVLAGQRPAVLELLVGPRIKRAQRELGLGLVFVTPAPVPFRRDLDGMIKYTQDALARAWGFNDAYVRALCVSMVVAPMDPLFQGGVFFWLTRKGDLPSGQTLEGHALDVLAHVQGVPRS